MKVSGFCLNDPIEALLPPGWTPALYKGKAPRRRHHYVHPLGGLELALPAHRIRPRMDQEALPGRPSPEAWRPRQKHTNKVLRWAAWELSFDWPKLDHPTHCPFCRASLEPCTSCETQDVSGEILRAPDLFVWCRACGGSGLTCTGMKNELFTGPCRGFVAAAQERRAEYYEPETP